MLVFRFLCLWPISIKKFQTYKSSNFSTKRKKEMPIEVKDLRLSDNLIDEEE